MAEFVAVLDTHERRVTNGFNQLITVTDSTVIGLRVNDGPTLTPPNVQRSGRVSERLWDMPDTLAFATQAFYAAIQCQGQDIPNGHIYDCHAYHDFAFGLSKNMTRSGVDGSLAELQRERLATFPLEMKPWEGYILTRDMGNKKRGRVHSFIALPRKYLVLPECLGVAGKDGPLTVSRTSLQPRLYGGDKFYRVTGLDEQNQQHEQ